MDKNRSNCHRCIHFYITWDSRFPSGCRAYGIKSRHLPATEVLRVTGKGCLCFAAKAKVPGSDPTVRLRPRPGDKFF